MRKLLLATVAVFGVGVGLADEAAQAQTAASPAPGTVTVRLNGRFRFFAGIFDDNDAANNLSGGNGTTPLTGTNKLANYGFAEYTRLYPGFDGVAANGLKYGASVEIRSDNTSGAGGGVYGSISQADRARGELYVRREWGYIGTDKLGTVRFGNTDPASSLYMTGNFENFNDGGLNGDVQNQLAQNVIVAWPFADVGNLYDTSKILYLSPQFFGFDFGVSYEPNSGNVNYNSGCGAGSFVGVNFINPSGATQSISSTTGSPITTLSGATGANTQSIAGPGCDRLSSTPTGDYTRRRNTFDGLIRYRGSFGGVGVAGTAGYIASSRVANDATPQPAIQYDGLSVGDFGLAVTYGGLSVGGKYQVGRYNGQWALDPRNGTQAEAWLVGASYTIGPVIVGAHYLNYKSTGDLTQTLAGRQRHEVGLAAGGTYSVAPGLALFLSYEWFERRQNGFNFITNTTNDFTAHNKVSSYLLTLGTSFSW